VVGVDPGKHEILHLTNDDASPRPAGYAVKTLRYTTRQRRATRAAWRAARRSRGGTSRSRSRAWSRCFRRRTRARRDARGLQGVPARARFSVQQQRMYAHYAPRMRCIACTAGGPGAIAAARPRTALRAARRRHVRRRCRAGVRRLVLVAGHARGLALVAH
jgi:hypothetical protein